MFSMVSHLSNSWARLSLRLYTPYRSSGEYRGGIGFPAAWPQAGQTSFNVYRPQAPHFFMTDRIAPQSFRWNFASPPFAVRALITRAAAFWISSSAVL